MTSLNRVVLEWTGNMITGRAVTVLYYSASDNAAPPVAAIKAAVQGMSATFPSGLAITVPGSGDVIDDTTGELTGQWTAPDGGTVTATGGGSGPKGVGACITLTTGGIVNGRKLRGRIFVVPLSAASYSADGLIVAGSVQSVLSFGSALQAAGPLAVWHRPTTAGGTDGNSYGVVQVSTRSKPAFLSSRRD